MNDLNIIIEGTSKIHNIDIPNIYGGFGADKKAITDKTIAELHNTEIKKIRQNIDRNKKQFELGVDIIDLVAVTLSDREINLLKSLGYSQNAINASKSIYLLSERGYMKLIKIQLRR